MSYAQSADPPGEVSGQLPFDTTPGLSDLVLYLDGLLSDDQAIEVHGLLLDIFGAADENPLSSLSGLPEGPNPGGGAMDSSGRHGHAHAPARPVHPTIAARNRLEARFPGAAHVRK